MRSYLNKFLLCLSCIVAPVLFQAVQAAPASNWVKETHLQTRLLSEFATLSPGHIYTLAIEVEPETGWHTTWAEMSVQWQGPEGSYFDDIQWPAVQRFQQTNTNSQYGFAGRHYLLTDFSIPASQSDTVTLEANIHWQVCSERASNECISGNTSHSVSLNIVSRTSEQTASSPVESNRSHFLNARQQLPDLAAWPARYDIQGDQLTILIESAAAVQFAQPTTENDGAYAYIGAENLIDKNAAQTFEYMDDILVIRQPLHTSEAGFTAESLPESFVVQLTGPTASNAGSVEFLVTAVQPELPLGNTNQADVSLLVVFVFAFLGGLILNLMPCVFPVLSLKAMALANSNTSRRKRVESLWYTAGVVLSFLVIAGTLIGLRAAGQALGWGFQLQNPWLIGSLVFLFVAIGLNLTGAFQFGTRLMGVGQNSAVINSSGGAKSSFATGVLAVLVASPCTAPFMGVALGYAITQPPALALLIFTVLGLGLAAPFLLLGFVPGFAKVLPKPGVWMDTFKQWMAVPMYITTVWLFWVFGRQTGIDSVTLLLLAVVLFATALWWWGKQQLKATRSKPQAVIVCIFLALAAFSFYQALVLNNISSATTNGSEASEKVWSQAKLDTLRNEQPVFVNMTADWCITCLANERVALNTDATRALFEEYNVAQLEGDWTMQDPAITEYLAEFGRNGVPLYVLYWPGKEPQVLPQILSNGIVREYIEAGANQ